MNRSDDFSPHLITECMTDLSDHVTSLSCTLVDLHVYKRDYIIPWLSIVSIIKLIDRSIIVITTLLVIMCNTCSHYCLSCLTIL